MNDFVSPRKVIPLTSHLLDTKIFGKLKQNALIKVDPSVVHFCGFNLNKTQRRSIKICNSSPERQNLHIIDPVTKYFSIKYTKPKRFVPGFTIEVVIEFKADEWRYYYDCIRLHCKGEENIIIPLHSYPVMDLSSFPKKIMFEPSCVTLGKSMRKVLPLRSKCPVDFEFRITVVQSDPALKVAPLEGIVPGEGSVSVVVTYTPMEYVTSHMTMQLNISQFNSPPFICNVTGNCSPKSDSTQRSVKDFDAVYKQTKILDPHSLSLVQISRSRRTLGSGVTEQVGKSVKYEASKAVIESLSQHTVNNIILQKGGKLWDKGVGDALLSKSESGFSLRQTTSRQMKEVAFKQDVRRDEIEERANHLRWQVYHGSKPLDENTQLSILQEREKANNEYRYRRRNEPQSEEELLRTGTYEVFRRTFRQADAVCEVPAVFDLYKNNPWLNRHQALSRFQQAARRILVRQRANKKIKMLRKMINNFRNGITEVPLEDASSLQLDVRSQSAGNQMPSLAPNPVFLMNVNNIKTFSFPSYISPDAKDDFAKDASDEIVEIENETSSITLKKGIPFHDIKVPKQYRVCGYKQTDIHTASRNYTPFTLPRSLRSGAEDEIIQVSITQHSTESPKPLYDEDKIARSPESTSERGVETSSGIIIPSGLLSNPPNHPLHIFNPFPGVQQSYTNSAQSIVDPDYHLCPIPQYALNPGESSYLDKDDVIKGVMAWKSFPPLSLNTQAHNSATLQDIGQPFWGDPFSEALVPTITPTLLKQMPLDSGVVAEPDDINSFIITPEAVRAQFSSECEQAGGTAAEQEDEQKQTAEATESTKQIYDQLGTKIRNSLKKIQKIDRKTKNEYF